MPVASSDEVLRYAQDDMIYRIARLTLNLLLSANVSNDVKFAFSSGSYGSPRLATT
jgi:hypothetical protein